MPGAQRAPQCTRNRGAGRPRRGHTASGVSCSPEGQDARPSACGGAIPTRAANDQPPWRRDRFRPARVGATAATGRVLRHDAIASSQSVTSPLNERDDRHPREDQPRPAGGSLPDDSPETRRDDRPDLTHGLTDLRPHRRGHRRVVDRTTSIPRARDRGRGRAFGVDRQLVGRRDHQQDAGRGDHELKQGRRGNVRLHGERDRGQVDRAADAAGSTEMTDILEKLSHGQRVDHSGRLVDGGRTTSGERKTRPAIRATGRRQRRARCVSLFAYTTSSAAACDRRQRLPASSQRCSAGCRMGPEADASRLSAGIDARLGPSAIPSVLHHSVRTIASAPKPRRVT